MKALLLAVVAVLCVVGLVLLYVVVRLRHLSDIMEHDIA